MKHTIKIIFTLLALTFGMINCKTDEATPATTTEGCSISKIYYANKTDGNYDSYAYNSDGTVASVTSYGSNKILGKIDFMYQNGLLSSQKDVSGAENKYLYSGTTLSKIQLYNSSARLLGEINIGFDANQRIKTMTIANTTSNLRFFEGVVSTFTYDANGNCTTIETKLSNRDFLSKTEFSNFVNVKSYYITMKGLVLDPFNYATDNLQAVPIWKSGNQSYSNLKITSYLDANNKPITPFVVSDIEYKRTANANSFLSQIDIVKSSTGASGSSIYEYTGCK